jgi:hypothetical protein
MRKGVVLTVALGALVSLATLALAAPPGVAQRGTLPSLDRHSGADEVGSWTPGLVRFDHMVTVAATVTPQSEARP